ncbi:MAG: glycosyltransferase family 2 protein, partial [Actinobacteria bacterium]|nr:glycosyltransferase family 2 protein [Actinomycetota bacterium]
MKKLLIIIPAFNEKDKIGEVIKKVPQDIQGIDIIKILVINDGSTDGTPEIARKIGVEVIDNYKNMGVGFSFGRGLQYAVDNSFDMMVNIDGDGQFDPGDIHGLLGPILEEGAEFVTASRFIDKKPIHNMSIAKLWGNRLMSILISHLVGKKYLDVSCGFRAYSNRALLSLNLHGRFTYTQETFIDLSFKGLDIREVPITVKYFPSRRSKVASNLFIYAVNTLKIILGTYRDYKPLAFFSVIALVFLVTGTAFEIVLLWTYLSRGTFSPNIWSGFVGAAFFFLSVI